MMIAAGSFCPAGWNPRKPSLLFRSEITVANVFTYKVLHAVDPRIEECHASSGLVNPCHNLQSRSPLPSQKYGVAEAQYSTSINA
jgi:hypothetical protein